MFHLVPNKGNYPDFFISCFLDCQKDRNLYVSICCCDRLTTAAARGDRPLTSTDDTDREEESAKSLNFKVSPHFKKEFKGFAVSQEISMTDLLKEGFALSKKHRQK